MLLFCTLALLGLAAAARAQNGRTTDFARSLSANLGMQGRVMWIEATANLDRITTREGVHDIVEHCRRANITTIVVDVKSLSGLVVYNSRIAERLREWKGKRYPDFDVLAAFVEEGRRAGVEIAASFNVFSEGHKYYNVGAGYANPEWQSVSFVVERALLSANSARLPVRAANEPEDSAKTLIQGDDYIQDDTQTPGLQIAVLLDEERRVAGVIDTALLDGEPLAAPEDGHMLVLNGPAMEWATRNLRAGDRTRFEAVSRRVPVAKASTEKVAVFVNPLNTEARRREIALMREVAENYAVDAIVFDRMRYANIYNDYSDLSRTAFEQWLGRRVANWPEDVIRYDSIPGEPMLRGHYFKKWLEFRARVIREFVREVTESIRAVKPEMKFGAYVGSWFTEYYGVGVNWGSEKFPVRLSWASPTYNEAGYAEFLDWLTTGCYYPVPTREEARRQNTSEGGTVEAAAEISSLVVANSVPVYAGIYVLSYEGRPEAFSRALATAARKSHGVMIFDLSQVYDYGWWNLLEQAFAQPVLPPHRVADYLSQVRAAQDAVRSARDARGSDVRLPAVPYQPGGG